MLWLQILLGNDLHAMARVSPQARRSIYQNLHMQLLTDSTLFSQKCLGKKNIDKLTANIKTESGAISLWTLFLTSINCTVITADLSLAISKSKQTKKLFQLQTPCSRRVVL